MKIYRPAGTQIYLPDNSAGRPVIGDAVNRDLAILLSDGVWETWGPTSAAGNDYDWTPLDNIENWRPSHIKVGLEFYLSSPTIDDSPAYARVYAQETGNTQAYYDSNVIGCVGGIAPTALISSQIRCFNEAIIPVNSLCQFDIVIRILNVSVLEAKITLREAYK